MIVPDGCVDLLWRDNRFTVAGPDIIAAHPEVTPGATILGFRFQPGAAASWLGLSMTEILGAEVSMEDIWGKRAGEITARMCDASDVHSPDMHSRGIHGQNIQSQADLLQTLLMKMLPAIEPLPCDAVPIFNFLQNTSPTNTAGSDSGRIAILSSQLDASERTLRRRSRHLFGYGLKTLDRILRFQKFQALARMHANAGLAEMALAAGYADQAHLSREVRALCGMTAAQFVSQLAS